VRNNYLNLLCYSVTFLVLSCNLLNPVSPSFKTGSMSDIDGNHYKTIKIGNQWWMAENLKVTHYRNGDAILNIIDDSTWSTLATGAYCVYDNDEKSVVTYGRLYNWLAVNDSRGLAPEGWHVPSDIEWKNLEKNLGMNKSQFDKDGWRGSDEGGKLKQNGFKYWSFPNTSATNVSGFSALPGGMHYYDSNYANMGWYASFWTSTEEIRGWYAWHRFLCYNSSKIFRYYNSQQDGFSVRLIKD
jgi:uncharacterized protein (TIGR02145 family)